MRSRRYEGRRLYVIWDNLNLHYDGRDGRWTRFNQDHRRRFRFVFTPLHASGVNQVEIWFSILQRPHIAAPARTALTSA